MSRWAARARLHAECSDEIAALVERLEVRAGRVGEPGAVVELLALLRSAATTEAARSGACRGIAESQDRPAADFAAEMADRRAPAPF